MQEINNPDKTIVAKVDGEDREFKMYYGLLNELMTTVRDLSDISLFFVDPDVRNHALTAILSQRDPRGKKLNTVGPEDVQIEFEELEKILNWAAAHVTAFFIRNLVQLTKQMQAIPGIAPSTPQESGSQAELPLTPISSGSPS